MIELYEDLKQMYIENQRVVMHKKEKFNREVKVLTKQARQYLLQLNNYSEEIDRNIKLINDSLRKLRRE